MAGDSKVFDLMNNADPHLNLFKERVYEMREKPIPAITNEELLDIVMGVTGVGGMTKKVKWTMDQVKQLIKSQQSVQKFKNFQNQIKELNIGDETSEKWIESFKNTGKPPKEYIKAILNNWDQFLKNKGK